MRRSLLLLSLWPWAVQADTLDHRTPVGRRFGDRFAPMPPPSPAPPRSPLTKCIVIDLGFYILVESRYETDSSGA